MTDSTTTEVKVVRAPALGGDDEDDDEYAAPRADPASDPGIGLDARGGGAGQSLRGQHGGEPARSPPGRRRRGAERYRAHAAAQPRAPKGAKSIKFSKDADTVPPFKPIGAAPPVPPPPPREVVASSKPSPPAFSRPMTPLTPLTNGSAPVATEARDVLDALEIAGIFDPHAAGNAPAVAWDPAAKKPRGKGLFALIAATLLFVGGIVGLFVFIRDKRAKEHEQAEVLLSKVDATLHASVAADLPGAEASLSHVFDLDSRSPRAALEWLRERALLGLLKGGSEIAFEDAMARAQEVGVKESDVAFARIASFLFQNDTVGAAALLPKWDDKAAKEPWYQLLAGATLARAGDVHAIDRFAAAAELDPGLVVAQIELARAMALDGDPAKAMERAKVIKEKFPGRPEGPALVALAWARDPARGDTPPADVEQAMKSAADLPLLAPVRAARDAGAPRHRRSRLRRGEGGDPEGPRSRRRSRRRRLAREHRARHRRRAARAGRGRKSIGRSRSAGATDERRARRRGQPRERSPRCAREADRRARGRRRGSTPRTSTRVATWRRPARERRRGPSDPTSGGSGQGLARRRRRREGRRFRNCRRVAKLESDAPKANAAGPDLAALAARVDKVEAALAAPETETRAVEEKLAAADNATTIAIIAEVAEERLRSGGVLRPSLPPCSVWGSMRRRWRPWKRWSTGRRPAARWPPRSTRLRHTSWPQRLRRSRAA